MRLASPLLARPILATLLLSLAACGPDSVELEEDAGTPTPGTDAGTAPPRTDAGTTPPRADAGTGHPGTDAGTGSGTTASRPISTYRDGIITYYAEANGTGNCSFDATPWDLDVAAIVKTEYQGSAVCGACAEIQGPKGTLRVRIVDSCPDCTTAGHLDLSPSAFDKLADRALGRVQVKWRFVTCPVTGAMRYRFKQGSSQYWTGIQVLNHHKPIRKLEWLNGLTWVEVPRQDYNYFVQSSGMGPLTLTLRITSWDGEVVQEVLPGILNSQILTGLRQFTPLP
ncbi:MAG TPA: expansin EXLX1 family cellulose-binding protein [Myxococcaceae bacterium]|nr:expansin EXLX1 family cellulose-binding protein [Myxococcaceae bacterium]